MDWGGRSRKISFPKVLERISFELGQQKSQFGISMQTPVENPLMTIESFNKQFQVGEKERETVKWGWEQEMGNTMFHVVNAYTRAAQFEGLPAEASYRLQKVGIIGIWTLTTHLVDSKNARQANSSHPSRSFL